uniref:Uncharacterized protein n=1 Tax=Onchocerca volvulus TaxID=6282 RepID=A0A8R1XRM8_ONCVO
MDSDEIKIKHAKLMLKEAIDDELRGIIETRILLIIIIDMILLSIYHFKKRDCIKLGLGLINPIGQFYCEQM